MNKFYTFLLLSAFAVLTISSAFATPNPGLDSLAVSQLDQDLGVSPLPTAELSSPATDSAALYDEDGHLRCVIVPVVNCVAKTVTLGAFLADWNGNSSPITVVWNTGATAHKITVPGGGFYSYDDSSFGCDHHQNTYTVDVFFPGPLEIEGTPVNCAGSEGELTVDLGGYAIESFLWNPNSGGVFSPIPYNAPGTFTLTIFDRLGCPYSDTYTVTYLPQVITTISGPVRMCPEGDSATLKVNGGPFVSYVWDHGATGSPIKVYEPGLYRVTVTTADGCTGEAVFGIESAEVVPFNIKATLPGICPGINDTLTVAELSAIFFKWSTGQTTRSIVVNQPGTYTVTVTNIYGCTTTTAITILPVSPPTPTLLPPILCPGTSAILSPTGGPYANYLWTGGTDTTFLKIDTSGTYRVTVSNSIGCTGSASVTVVANPLPNVAITGPPVACPGQTVLLVASPGFVAYTWSNGSSNDSLTVGQTGIYTVQVIDSSGCKNTATRNFSIINNPVPQVAVLPYACNNTLTLQADAGFQGYQWSTGATTQTIDVGNPGNYTVTVTAGVGCTGSSVQSVTIPANPQVGITGLTEFCAGNSGQIQATAGFVGYSWDSGQSSAAITVTTSGNYTVTVTDGNGCTATRTIPVTAYPLPQPAIQGPPSVCLGFSAQLAVTTAYSQYAWSNASSQPSVSVNQTGNYTVTVTDTNGCTGTTTHNLVVNTALNAQIGQAPYTCNNQLQLSADPGFVLYSWSNGDNTQTATVQASGTYTVTVTDLQGCTGTAVKTIQIPANPLATVIGTTQICPGGVAVLSLNNTFSQYKWSDGSTGPTASVSSQGLYTVTVTDALGCTTTATHQLNIGNQLSINMGVSPYACNNQLSLTPGSGFLTYAWSNGANTPVLTVTANGNYTVTVTDATGCTGVTTQNVSIPTNPTTQIAGPAQVCFGNSAQLNATAGYALYSWSNGSQANLTTVSQSGTYTVTVTDANNCTATAAATFQVLLPVQPGITGPTLICPGAQATFAATANFSQYVWSNGGTTPTVQVGQAGAYLVTVTDANGCTGTASRNLAISTPPAPAISVAPYSCNNLLALSTAPGLGTYQWSNGSTAPTTNATNSGSFTVTVTDALGCTGTAVQNVNIPQNPLVTLSGPAQVCAGIIGQLQTSGTFPQYQWSGGQISADISVFQSGTYTVTVTDANNCTATASASMTVLPPIVPVLDGTTLICPGNNTTFSVGGTFNQYKWSNGAVTPTITVTQAGTYSVTVTDSNGCTGTGTRALSISVPPAPTISVAPYACDNTLLLSTPAGWSSYSWSSGSQVNTLLASASGSYTVTVTDALGCTGTAFQNILLPANPSVTISGDPGICAGQQSTFAASGNFQKYQWSNGQATQSINIGQGGNYLVTVTDNNGCTATASLMLTVFQPSTTQINKISCFVQDTGMVVTILANIHGCDSTITTRTALSPPLFADAQITTDFNGFSVPCNGDAKGTAAVTATGGVPPFQYTWSNGSNAANLNSLTAGNYTVTVRDANGCLNSSNVTLNQPPAILPTLAQVPVACFTPGAISVNTIGGGATPYTILCNLEEKISDGLTLVEFKGLAPGSYLVSVTDANGCSTTQPVILDPPSLSLETFLDTIWMDAGNRVQLTAPSGYDYLDISWSPSTGLSCDDCPKSIATVTESTNYTVALNGYGSCEILGRYVILVRPGVYVPNVIDPSSDYNNLFTIYSADDAVFDINVLQIFTRWGEKVEEIRNFKPNGPTGWKGDFRGQGVMPGVYVYYAEVTLADGTKYLLKGDVTVVR
jgi:hypothetical protein